MSSESHDHLHHSNPPTFMPQKIFWHSFSKVFHVPQESRYYKRILHTPPHIQNYTKIREIGSSFKGKIIFDHFLRKYLWWWNSQNYLIEFSKIIFTQCLFLQKYFRHSFQVVIFWFPLLTTDHSPQHGRIIGFYISGGLE